jgi:hypothetical protein
MYRIVGDEGAPDADEGPLRSQDAPLADLLIDAEEDKLVRALLSGCCESGRMAGGAVDTRKTRCYSPTSTG